MAIPVSVSSLCSRRCRDPAVRDCAVLCDPGALSARRNRHGARARRGAATAWAHRAGCLNRYPAGPPQPDDAKDRRPRLHPLGSSRRIAMHQMLGSLGTSQPTVDLFEPFQKAGHRTGTRAVLRTSGLPLLLAAGRDVDAYSLLVSGFTEEGGGMAELAAARSRGRSGRPADHVWDRGREWRGGRPRRIPPPHLRLPAREALSSPVLANDPNVGETALQRPGGRSSSTSRRLAPLLLRYACAIDVDVIVQTARA